MPWVLDCCLDQTVVLQSVAGSACVMCSAAQTNGRDDRRSSGARGNNSTRQASIAKTAADDREKNSSGLSPAPKQAIVKLSAAKAALEASRAENGKANCASGQKGPQRWASRPTSSRSSAQEPLLGAPFSAIDAAHPPSSVAPETSARSCRRRLLS